MNIRAGLSGFCLSFLISAVGGAQVRGLAGCHRRAWRFRPSGSTGSRLLLIPNLARPELLKAALCSGGRRLAGAVRAPTSRRRERRKTDLAQLRQVGGERLCVPGNPIEPDAPCFLASEALLTGSAVLSVAAAAGSGACLERGRFATLRARPVVHCWPLARLASEKQVALLEFERRGKDALASLVVVDGSRTMFADFHAEFRGPGEDLWRVDDGGVLSPAGLRSSARCSVEAGCTCEPPGPVAEGTKLIAMDSQGSERFTQVIKDYWYQAPM